MNPCALAPQDINVTHHDVAGKCILMANRDEMIQPYERRQLARIVASGRVAFDTNHMTSKLSGQDARRTTQTTPHIENDARRRHASSVCELPNRFDTAAVVLIGQLRFQIDGELQFRNGREGLSIALETLKNRCCTQRMRGVDRIEVHPALIQ